MGKWPASLAQFLKSEIYNILQLSEDLKVPRIREKKLFINLCSSRLSPGGPCQIFRFVFRVHNCLGKSQVHFVEQYVCIELYQEFHEVPLQCKLPVLDHVFQPSILSCKNKEQHYRNIQYFFSNSYWCQGNLIVLSWRAARAWSAISVAANSAVGRRRIRATSRATLP